MNKIAAYEIALENIELEKRADYLVEAYGTCQGEMPGAYLQAFDQIEMEKEAILSAIGKGITGAGKSFSNWLGRSGAAAAKAQGTVAPGAAVAGARRTAAGNALSKGVSAIYKDPNAVKVLGGAAVGAGGLGLGAGVMGGRMSKS